MEEVEKMYKKEVKVNVLNVLKFLLSSCISLLG